MPCSEIGDNLLEQMEAMALQVTKFCSTSGTHFEGVEILLPQKNYNAIWQHFENEKTRLGYPTVSNQVNVPPPSFHCYGLRFTPDKPKETTRATQTHKATTN